jgi:D-aspartate ligase
MRAVSTLHRAVILDPNDGCLTIARCLAAKGVEVVTVIPPRGHWIRHSRAARGILVGPLPEGTAEWLSTLHSLSDRPGVLISGSDAATEWLVRHRGDISLVLQSFESETSAHLRLMDKSSLLELATELGVRVPWAHRVESREDLDALVARQLPMPCVAKPALGHVARRAGDFATRAIQDTPTLIAHVGSALDLGIPMLVTEQIPGSPLALEGAVTLHDRDGRLVLEYGRRKLRDYPVGYGIGVLTETIPAVEALDLAGRLLTGAGYVGVASTEFKRHADTGELVLIEVNVRIPQTFGLAQAGGTDGPWRLYAALAGLPLGPQPTVRMGAKNWIPQLDLHSVRELRRRGQVSVKDVARSLHGVRDHGAFSWRDPGPGLALAGEELRALRRRLSRVRQP